MLLGGKIDPFEIESIDTHKIIKFMELAQISIKYLIQKNRQILKDLQAKVKIQIYF